MKPIKTNFILLVILSVAVVSCQNVPYNFPSTTVNNNVSSPAIKLIGPAYVHIPVGGAFTDKGATLTDEIHARPVTIYAAKGQVNIDSPGIYAVTYSAANNNGYKASVTRTVLVLNYSKPSTLTGNYDIEGLYQRIENGQPVNVIRMDTGLYILDNFAGSSLVYPAYMTMLTDSTINVPAQKSFGGFRLAVTGETFSPIDSSFSYSVQAVNFGTEVRHFDRVH